MPLGAGAGAARKKIPGAGAAWEKNKEPEPEPLKNFAGSQALVQTMVNLIWYLHIPIYSSVRTKEDLYAKLAEKGTWIGHDELKYAASVIGRKLIVLAPNKGKIEIQGVRKLVK